MRLTLFYAGLFLLLGTLLLALVYVLASRGSTIDVAVPAPVVRRQLKLPGGIGSERRVQATGRHAR